MRIGVLTVSDRSARGERPDVSGPALAEFCAAQGWSVSAQSIVPDEVEAIQAVIKTWCADQQADVILTTGGTGFAPRDVTPEATLGVIERLAPGLAEAMRAGSLGKTPHAMLSRSVAGIRGHCLIVNLPGSPTAAVENLAVLVPVLPHAVQLLQEDPLSEQGHHKES